MIDPLNIILNNSLNSIGLFLPKFLAGFFVFLIGFLFGSIIKHVIIILLNFLRIDEFLHKTKLTQKGKFKGWIEVTAEFCKWTITVIFLIPTLEIWGLSKATSVLYDFISNLPNIIIAVIILFVGLILSNIAHDLVKQSIKTLGAKSANTLSLFTKWLIIFFTALVVLDQLGIAQDLIRILFTGIVAMIAIAGGLAFGLGGKDVAKELLENLKKKLES